MTVCVRLKPSAYEAGGKFEKQGRRAVLILSGSRDDIPLGRLMNIHEPSNDNWVPGETIMSVTANGIRFSDASFEILTKRNYNIYISQIVQMVEKNLVEVLNNAGTPLTVAQILAFTA